MDKLTNTVTIKVPVGFQRFFDDIGIEDIAKYITVEEFHDSCGGAIPYKYIIRARRNLGYCRHAGAPTKAEKWRAYLINQLICLGVIDPFEFIANELIKMGIYKP